MRNIVKGLRAIGYQVVVSRLSEEENTVWQNMVASATSAQQALFLPEEDKVWWQKQVASESCLHCAYDGQEFCLKHN